MQSAEDLNGTKQLSKRELLLPGFLIWNIGLFLPLLELKNWLFLGLEPVGFRLEFIPSALLVLRSSNLD